jgi:hypothetical protein
MDSHEFKIQKPSPGSYMTDEEFNIIYQRTLFNSGTSLTHLAQSVEQSDRGVDFPATGDHSNPANFHSRAVATLVHVVAFLTHSDIAVHYPVEHIAHVSDFPSADGHASPYHSRSHAAAFPDYAADFLAIADHYVVVANHLLAMPLI